MDEARVRVTASGRLCACRRETLRQTVPRVLAGGGKGRDEPHNERR
jgi:hypothetical protein